MKKLLLSIGLALASVNGFAQQHEPQDLLVVRALNVGTNSAGVGITNFATWASDGLTIAGAGFQTNVVYTNATGSQTRGLLTKLFNDVQLWHDRNGAPLLIPSMSGNSGTSLNSNLTYSSGQTLVIEVVNPAANPSNGPIGIVMSPVWADGLYGSTNANADWSIIIPGFAKRKYVISTNVPAYRWIGAKAFTVRYITNQTDIGGVEALTNGTFITKMKVVGFRP